MAAAGNAKRAAGAGGSADSSGGGVPTLADAVLAVSIAIGADAMQPSAPTAGSSAPSKPSVKSAKPTIKPALKSNANSKSRTSGDQSPTGSDGSDENQPLVAVAREALGGTADGSEWLDDEVREDQRELYFYWSIASVTQWVLTRSFTVLLLLLGGGHHWLNRTSVAFFVLELVLTAYYWHQRKYFPGSVYTDLHFLFYGRALRPVRRLALPPLSTHHCSADCNPIHPFVFVWCVGRRTYTTGSPRASALCSACGATSWCRV
jgi:hypothetical protein